MSSTVFVDSASFTYYRVTATSAWWMHQGNDKDSEIPKDILESQYLSCLSKFSKKVGVAISEMILVRDCPIDNIWRIEHYPDYKLKRRNTNDAATRYGHYIKHLNTVMKSKFKRVLRVPTAEADDVIGVLVGDGECTGTIHIVTGDSDYTQLLRFDNVHIHNPKDWKSVTCDDPVAALEKKIRHGDPSDGIRAAKNDEELAMNRMLVDLTCVPESLRNKIKQAYRTYPIQLGLCCMNTILRKREIFCSRTLRLGTIESKGMQEIYKRAIQNCKDLIPHLEWNYAHGIRVFRMSSDLFPFKNSSKLKENYDLDFARDILEQVGALARQYGQRLTFHPGQYCVVGTNKEEVFDNTVAELDWHAEVLDIMGCGCDSVIVIHGGGIYGDKPGTKQRWVSNFARLPERVRRRLVLENCEKSFSIEDCLEIAEKVNIPVVMDSHHYQCYVDLHPKETLLPPEDYIPAVLATWQRRGIKPKFHVSEQCEGKQVGAHSDLIEDLPQYLLDIPRLYDTDIDIMIEAKLKEQAIFKLYDKYPELDTRPAAKRGLKPVAGAKVIAKPIAIAVPNDIPNTIENPIPKPKPKPKPKLKPVEIPIIPITPKPKPKPKPKPRQIT